MSGLLVAALLAAVRTVCSIGSCVACARAEGGIVFKGVLVHNVVGLCRQNDGLYLFRRAGTAAHDALGDLGKRMNEGNTGVEFRFVMRGESVQLRLGGRSDDSHAEVRVYHGDVIGDWPELVKTVHGRDCVITVRKSGNLQTLRERAARRHDRFDPQVVRLVLPHGDIGIRDVIGDVEPPCSAQLPKRTYLAYGSSITHGSNALAIEECYASIVGRGLGADVRNLGFAGSAAMEGAIADFIAGEKFDVASLELGVNVLGWMKADQFEKRVRYFVRQVAATHPQAKVVVTDVLGNCLDDRRKRIAADFRAVVKKVVGELALPNVVYVSGLDLLADGEEMSSGGLHPTPAGHRLIAERFLKAYRK